MGAGESRATDRVPMVLRSARRPPNPPGRRGPSDEQRAGARCAWFTEDPAHAGAHTCSVSIHIPSVDALFLGDTMTTRNVLTGITGPKPKHRSH